MVKLLKNLYLIKNLGKNSAFNTLNNLKIVANFLNIIII